MTRKLFPVFGFILIAAVFFWQFLFKGLLPIPSDTIAGLYHPYRDFYSNDYPNGIPFKNFLITDPVRQQYPWRELSANALKNLETPKWNPYSFSGTPLLANFQSAAFYPFNIIYFIFPTEYAWSIIILIQPLLASIFMFYFLKNLKLDDYSSFFGGIIFAYSGFFVTWLEWGIILNTALWLPLIILSIDKIFQSSLLQRKFEISKYKIPEYFLWVLVFIFSISSSLLAGHLQTFFYLFIFSLIYLTIRIVQNKNKVKFSLVFLTSLILFAIVTFPQWVITLKFIFLSGRGEDQLIWQKEGWFIPFHHLVQFLVPDFFGNPATLNYWGTWNYGELTGYIGIIALVFAIFAAFFRRDKKTFLLISVVVLGLVIATLNPISKIPFIFSFPFISTAQPTRVLFIVDFALSILAALGLNYFIIKGKMKQIMIPIGIVGLLFFIIFSTTYLGNLNTDPTNILVVKRNIIFPTMIFVSLIFILIIYALFKKKYKSIFFFMMISLVLIDLFRFSWKFNTFSKKEYLYPQTQIINFLQKNTNNFRIASDDPRIMPPNFPIIHRLNSVEGYDPLYLSRYAEFISAINRNEPNINPPFGFNRIIRVENFTSDLIDLMGVKYLLSFSDINIDGFEKVFAEGQTIVYENKEVLPRAFFVENVEYAANKNEVIELMFNDNFNPREKAIIEENISINSSTGDVKIIKYSENEIIINTKNDSEGFMILTDSFYPTWHVKINGKEGKIYLTNFIYRGVIIPAGDNQVVFSNNLL